MFCLLLMYKQHIVQHFTDERSPFNLKTQLKKLIFDGGKPQVICEDPATFAMVMSTFTQHEKYVSGVKHLCLALFPVPTQLFIAFSTEKWERAWYLSSREWHQERKDDRKGALGPEQWKEPRYQITYYTYLVSRRWLSYTPSIEHVG